MMQRYSESAERAAMNRDRGLRACVWPECNREPWRELDLPVCQVHAAKIHLAVGDAIPKPTLRESRAEPGRHRGRVYFASVGEYIKIGHSTNIRRRMAELGGEHLASFEGTPADERREHQKFAEYSISGEFFRPGLRLVARIAQLRTRSA